MDSASKQYATPLYLDDLASCDIYLFPKAKSVLKGTHTHPLSEVKLKELQIC